MKRRREGPMLARPISCDRFADEVAAVLGRAPPRVRGRDRVDGTTVSLDSPELALAHRWSARRFADCDHRGREIRFAPEARRLPRAHRLGLIAHEVGHLLARPRHSEDEADEAAREHLGVEVSYDRRWPGKGLQRGRIVR